MDPYLVIRIPVLIFSIVIHESAHGWMAEKCGDSTARLAGRITLNPIPHIDIFGSIILPLILFMANSPFMIGYAKPVPVNYYNLRKPRRDAALVGLAGPIANMIASLGSVLILIIIKNFNFNSPGLDGILVLILSIFSINLFLAFFNLIPIPPLDGSRVVSWLLPTDLAYKYNQLEPYGFLIIMLLMYAGLLDKIFTPIIYLVQYGIHYLV
ncbi:site-2 protease family protein [Candidatus Poribacteria bacterium]|nr:site-2 protease family protein [Candidatus Poribacteria bacterium]